MLNFGSSKLRVRGSSAPATPPPRSALVSYSRHIAESMFPLLPLGKYLLPLISLNRYLPGCSNKRIYYEAWGIPGNHATFGFCHDSIEFNGCSKRHVGKTPLTIAYFYIVFQQVMQKSICMLLISLFTFAKVRLSPSNHRNFSQTANKLHEKLYQNRKISKKQL